MAFYTRITMEAAEDEAFLEAMRRGTSVDRAVGSQLLLGRLR